MKVCLDLHDFSVVNNRLDLLLKLKEHFPGFKVSLFIVAKDEIQDWGSSLIWKDYLGEIRKHLDWLQIIPHALEHSGSEVENVNRIKFGSMLTHIGLLLDYAELPYVRGFCAPHWRWNGAVVQVLDNLGWWGAVDRDKIMPCPKKFYKYNFLLNEPFYNSDLEVLKIHGHIYGTKNDVGRCFDNLMKLPLDTEWHFVTDFLEDK